MFTKISICLFLLRIVDSKKVRTAMHVVIGALVVFTAIFVCLFLGVCRPLKAYWDIGVDSVCLSDNVFENIVIAQGGTSSLPLTRQYNKLTFGSSLNYYRPDLCCIPRLFP